MPVHLREQLPEALSPVVQQAQPSWGYSRKGREEPRCFPRSAGLCWRSRAESKIECGRWMSREPSRTVAGGHRSVWQGTARLAGPESLRGEARMRDRFPRGFLSRMWKAGRAATTPDRMEFSRKISATPPEPNPSHGASPQGGSVARRVHVRFSQLACEFSSGPLCGPAMR